MFTGLLLGSLIYLVHVPFYWLTLTIFFVHAYHIIFQKNKDCPYYIHANLHVGLSLNISSVEYVFKQT